jgi:hypothetical protein
MKKQLMHINMVAIGLCPLLYTAGYNFDLLYETDTDLALKAGFEL